MSRLGALEIRKFFGLADLCDVFVIVKFFPKFNFLGILNM